MDALARALGAVRFADALDVFLLTLFFFVGIGWLRRSSSGSAARRITALGALLALLYLAADLFGLYLVEKLLEVLFLFLLIAVAVVFQADIRRLLDRLASWRPGGAVQRTGAGSPVNVLVEAVTHLAEHRTGALIAIRGADSWSSHVHGGIDLDGRISRPLLYSLFHPETPGHDGAVLVEGNRIVRFAAHLPLALRLPKESRAGGTRHAAALGLAEETDALVLVVSEERGTISIAQNGRLDVLAGTELAERLERFWVKHYSPARAQPSALLSRRTAETGAMAVGLAALSWFLFSYSGDVLYRSFEIPIEFRNLPPSYAVTEAAQMARVTLSGTAQDFEQLDPQQLSASFDLADPDVGPNQLVITEETLRMPSSLDLYDVTPRTLTVEIERQASREVPVIVRRGPGIPDSIALRPTPPTVRLLFPADVRDPPSEVRTEEVGADQLREGPPVTAKLLLPPDARLAGDQTAEVEIIAARRQQ